KMRQQLETIYARICEAYRVLTSPEKRTLYDKGLARGRMRFEGGDRPSPQGPKNPEDTITHPQSKKFFRLGMMSVGKKDWKGAVSASGARPRRWRRCATPGSSRSTTSSPPPPTSRPTSWPS